MTVGELKDQLDDYGDHIDVVIVSRDGNHFDINAVSPATARDGSAVAALDIGPEGLGVGSDTHATVCVSLGMPNGRRNVMVSFAAAQAFADPAPYAWVVTRDHLDEKDVNVTGPGTATPAQIALARKGRAFRMYDDDGELYYSGRVWTQIPDGEELFGPLDDYGTPNAGATEIRYHNGTRWETL